MIRGSFHTRTLSTQSILGVLATDAHATSGKAGGLNGEPPKAGWFWHLWAVSMDLTSVGGHLSPVDDASIVVATAPSNAGSPSSAVETARLNVEVSPAAADFASSADVISPVADGSDWHDMNHAKIKPGGFNRLIKVDAQKFGAMARWRCRAAGREGCAAAQPCHREFYFPLTCCIHFTR
jgi:hypothetical protein